MAEHRSFRLTAGSNASNQQPFVAAGAGWSRAITIAVSQQAGVLLFASLILDGGVILRFCTIAAIASWVCTFVILLRRPKRPTPYDLAIVKFGFWPALFFVTVLGVVVNALVR